MAAQLAALGSHSRGTKARAVGLALTEADPGHPVRAVSAVRIGLAHQPLEVHARVGEGPDRAVPGLGQQLPERLVWPRPQPDDHGVAVIPDGILGPGTAVQHRGRDEEIGGLRVAVHHCGEGCHQHHVRGGTGLPTQRRRPVDDGGRQPHRRALRAPGTRHHRTVGARKFQRLGQIHHQGPPVIQVRGADFGLARRGGSRRGCGVEPVRVGIGVSQIGEKRCPRTVVPGDMVGGEQQHQLVGRQPRRGDPQRRVLGEVEGPAKVPLGQHIQPQSPGLIGQAGQVMLGPLRPQVRADHRIRVAVTAGLVRRVQHGVPRGHGVHGAPQPRRVDVSGEAVGDTDVEQRAVGVHRLHKPHAVLTGGQPRFVVRRHGRHARPGQAAVGYPAAQQLQPLVVETGAGAGGVSHARSPTFLASRALSVASG